MKFKLFFITGVPGSGKSTIVEPLRAELGTYFEVYDFDERGVPDNVTNDWAKGETWYWEETALKNAKRGIHTVVSGFALPENLSENSGAVFLLLDLKERDLRERLLGRYNNKPQNIEDLARVTGMTPETFLKQQIGSIPWLRNKCELFGSKVIDTSGLTPIEVVKHLSKYINSTVD